MIEQKTLHLDITPNQAAVLFLSLKNLEQMSTETGYLYQELERYLYARIGLEELQTLEDLYARGEL
ncbi:hypothetical protein [Entomospira culicis]|uniref:Uncharacterized protein n=1 Tax=Entomospira culicis TaxID=2719989 RepID=A0A968GGE2_9SPIO|nr:hypothetical protein [Entomospira culicis]NIZ19273.1 hypothetical protein [Entomospira culicis]NIZ69822.1 hypothetical protein [Entomospira culicis]WDI36929.1 hypothetical protein PVA46_06295 [Entomospira culicis]WDI38558.1 hypothetical protein PVA47_06305 [Entomospira culicis]